MAYKFSGFVVLKDTAKTKHAVLAIFFPADSFIGSAIVDIATSLCSF
jgi:hypothetical protein